MSDTLRIRVSEREDWLSKLFIRNNIMSDILGPSIGMCQSLRNNSPETNYLIIRSHMP